MYLVSFVHAYKQPIRSSVVPAARGAVRRDFTSIGGDGMQYPKSWFLLLLTSVCLSLAGCGGSSSGSGTVSDPMAAGTTGGTTTPTGSGTVLSYTLSLSVTDVLGTSSAVGASADVLATARVFDSAGNPVANQPVLYEKVDVNAPATITTPIVNTTSTGEAVNILKAGNPATTTDVIIKASTSVNGQYLSAIAIFRILKSQGNVINFLTTKGITDPDGSLNSLSYTIKNIDPALTPAHGFVQLVPFEVLDLNGIPRSRAEVSLSIYSVLGSNCSAFIDSPEPPTEKTVTTDDNGKGIFNAVVSIPTPSIGGVSTCSVIYKATTNDLISASNPKIYTYGGFIVTLKNELP